jgi:hypothetical protein
MKSAFATNGTRQDPGGGGRNPAKACPRAGRCPRWITLPLVGKPKPRIRPGEISLGRTPIAHGGAGLACLAQRS